MEKSSDYLALGKRYCRVLYLKDFASYIKDSPPHPGEQQYPGPPQCSPRF